MVYIPRGFITIKLALDQLFAARHPDLAATGSAYEAECVGLFERIRAAKPLASPILAIGHRGPHHVEEIRQPVNFSREDRQRLQELTTENTKFEAMRLEGASILREALAEGDLTSTLVTRSGREILIKSITWRAEDGLERVKSGRAWVPLPLVAGEADGEAVIKQIDLIAWLSANFPKGFPELSIVATPNTFALTPNQILSSQISNIIAFGSPLMQQAEANARNLMNQRGLINSSQAISAAQSALYAANTIMDNGPPLPLSTTEKAVARESGSNAAGASSQAAGDDTRRSSDDVSTLQAQPRSLIAAKNPQIRKAGRPSIKGTAMQLYRDRRGERLPLEATRLQEAQAIIARWPIGGLGKPKPKAKTVSQLLSDVWQQERNTER